MDYWKNFWLFFFIWNSSVYSEHEKKFAVRYSLNGYKTSPNSTTKLSKLHLKNNENATEDLTLKISNNTNQENSTLLDHFTKFNWTVLEGGDHLYDGSVIVPSESTTENYEIMTNITSTETTTRNASSRRGHERDLLVVLPVMQGNSDLSNFNLQMLYTKSPVTTIIEERSNDVVKQESTEASDRVLERRGDSSEKLPSKREDGKRHPYTDFLFTKSSSSKSKSPLDYGYPESFKFVQELNDLPKNHKPEWAVSELTETSSPEGTPTEATTKRDPFQMFESVKPLEINKLLSLSAPITDSIVEETITKKMSDYPSHIVSKIPLMKRPTKKPQKTKLSAVVTKFTEPAVLIYSSTSTPEVDNKLYTAARYTTLFSQSTKSFLPTPYISLNDNAVVYAPKEELRVTFTSPTVTTLKPESATDYTTNVTNLQNSKLINLTYTSTARSVPECSTDGIIGNRVKPSDLINLTKILGNTKTISENRLPTKELPSRDDFLSNDVKNILIALGILKSENEPTPSAVTTSTSTPNWDDLFIRKELVTPKIDANSYQTFKKIPIDGHGGKLPANDDMTDLLASFGLIPRKSIQNSILTRISRQYKVDNETDDFFIDVDDKISKQFNAEKENLGSYFNTTANPEENFFINLTKSNDSFSMFPNDVKNTLENLGFLKPLPFNYPPHKNGHVFQPAIHLEKLGDDEKVQKINDVIKTIKKLSNNKDTDSLSKEEIEEKLENITTTVLKEDDQLSEIEVFDNAPETHTETSNTTDSETTNKTVIVVNDFNHTVDESVISKLKTNASFNVGEKNLAMNPPNPLSPEELQLLYDTNKNEIKRQQPTELSIDLLSTTASTASSTATESSTTAENNNAPISDLAESFGGGETASEEPAADDVSTPKPNGLYFYVDWNTFLNVGESDKNPVRVRFSPRAGNPRNFLPITVP